MKTMTVSRAAAICGGRLTQYSDAPIGRAIIDSRQVQPGDMFVAYRGENVDGHRFIAKALEAGASGIVVSNHGGRVQGCTPATAEVLPAIAKAVKGKIKIFVDGGIRSGVDVFKAIGLGADAVLIGRPVVPFIYAEGEEGFKVYMDRIVSQLRDTMNMCGTPTLADIGEDNIFIAK